MHKIVLNHNGTEIDFYLHDSTEKIGKQQAIGMLDIIYGKTYPVVKNVKPKMIIDVCANIGAASYFFAKEYPNSKIYSFEPTTINFLLLQKNIKHFSNVKIFQKGVNEENKQQKIYINTKNPGTNSIYEKWRKFDDYEYVNFINLKSFLKEKNIKNIDILKIDTEGCEINVLKSIKTFLKKISVIYLEYHNEQQGLIIRNLLSKTHNIKNHHLCGVDTVPINNLVIGRINFNSIIYNKVTIIFKNQTINSEHVEQLQRIGHPFIKVVSKQLGEICFVNNNLEMVE